MNHFKTVQRIKMIRFWDNVNYDLLIKIKIIKSKKFVDKKENITIAIK